MSHRIAIIGAGQSGLQLALGLISNGHHVTLINDRNANDILNGFIMSNQGMFDEALQFERNLNIDYWKNSAPQNRTVTFTIAQPNTAQIGITWQGFTDQPFQSVDQRLKFSYWLEEFAKKGGDIRIQNVTMEMLENLEKCHDLTIVASGKGELSKLFKQDLSRSIHFTPPRILSCLYVTGMESNDAFSGVRASVIPGVGEYFTMAGLSIHGPCEMMLFECIPGGPFDCWNNIFSSQKQLEIAVSLLKKYVPWEAKRCENLTLVDKKATLIGSYIPEVRHPVCYLKSGQPILGMADTVVLNDPIAGQGANNASKCAQIYMECINKNLSSTFDGPWMLATFEKYWRSAQWSTALSNLLLDPPKPHVLQLLASASTIPSLANLIANGFAYPGRLFPWINSPQDTLDLIKKHTITELEEPYFKETS